MELGGGEISCMVSLARHDGTDVRLFGRKLGQGEMCRVSWARLDGGRPIIWYAAVSGEISCWVSWARSDWTAVRLFGR